MNTSYTPSLTVRQALKVRQLKKNIAKLTAEREAEKKANGARTKKANQLYHAIKVEENQLEADQAELEKLASDYHLPINVPYYLKLFYERVQAPIEDAEKARAEFVERVQSSPIGSIPWNTEHLYLELIKKSELAKLYLDFTRWVEKTEAESGRMLNLIELMDLFKEKVVGHCEHELLHGYEWEHRSTSLMSTVVGQIKHSVYKNVFQWSGYETTKFDRMEEAVASYEWLRENDPELLKEYFGNSVGPQPA